jgi:hypothetical protein
LTITITVASHPATAWTNSKANSEKDIFKGSCPQHSQAVIQSSFPPTCLQTASVYAAYHVVDPDLGASITPSFSTTTENDRVVSAILMMGAMRKYFA